MTHRSLPPDLPTDLARQLTTAGQGPVCADWAELGAVGRSALVTQLQSLDWPLIGAMRQRVIATRESGDAARPALPSL